MTEENENLSLNDISATKTVERKLVIDAKGLHRTYGRFEALKPIDLQIGLGRIVGVIGANGAGKTTLLNAILGLSHYEGGLSVLGLSPARERDILMQDVCFIADVATLPRWMRAKDVLDFVEGVHPRFNRAKALDFLSRTKIPLDKKIGKLSKGMVAQLHLALVMAIDAKLLVLDEPTLGLDILFRKQFYKSLLEEYFDEERTIIVTTHQVEEVEHILTDVVFLKDGALLLQSEMDDLESEFCELMVKPGAEAQAQALNPLSVSHSFGRTICVYRGVASEKLSGLGDIRRMGLADIFVALMKGEGQ